MMGISISTPMPDDGNCQVIEHLEARPLRARRGWSAEAKARLVEKKSRKKCTEIVIGEVVLRVGSDVEPNHLANVIRAVRKA